MQKESYEAKLRDYSTNVQKDLKEFYENKIIRIERELLSRNEEISLLQKKIFNTTI